MGTVAPAGLSGRGASSSPEALPSHPRRSRTAQAQRGAGTLESSLAGQGAPHGGSPEHICLTQRSRFIPGLSRLELTGVLTRESLLSTQDNDSSG